MIVTSIILASLLGFALRIPFALWPLSSNSDGLGTLSKLSILKKYGFTYDIPDAVQQPNRFHRPLLFLYFISVLPKRWWRIGGVLLNCLFDILLIIPLLALAQHEAPALIVGDLPLLLTLLVLLTTPLFFPITARLKSPNSRTMGSFLGAAYLTLLYFAETDPVGMILYLLAAVFVFYLVILTSTFSTQFCLLASVFIAGFALSLLPLVAVIATMGLALLSNFCGARNILRFKWNHLQFSWRSLDKSYSSRGRNLIPNFFRFFDPRIDRQVRVELLTKTSPLWIVLLGAPTFVCAIIVTVVQLSEGPPTYLHAIILSGASIFLITSTGIGRLIGESERYLESMIPFALILVLSYASAHPLMDYVLATFVVWQLLVMVVLTVLTYPRAMDRLLSFAQLNEAGVSPVIAAIERSDARIAAVPMKLARLMSALTIDHDTRQWKFYYKMIPSNDSWSHGLSAYLEEEENANGFKVSVSFLKDRYDLHYFLFEKRFIEKYKSIHLELEQRTDKLIETDQFLLYSLERL